MEDGPQIVAICGLHLVLCLIHVVLGIVRIISQPFEIQDSQLNLSSLAVVTHCGPRVHTLGI